jgi:hypothetical protein
MAGVTGHKALTDGLFQMLMQADRNIKADVQEAALEAAIAGQEKVRWTIANTASAIVEGKPNRNWTFNMSNSVDSDVKRTGTSIQIRVGWLHNKEGYFLIQEHGQGSIWAMDSLEAGRTEVLKTLTRWGIKTV